jgi:hypothetical protein
MAEADDAIDAIVRVLGKWLLSVNTSRTAQVWDSGTQTMGRFRMLGATIATRS